MTDQIHDLDVIPDALKSRDQWLHWDNENDTPRRPHQNGDFTVAWSSPDEWLEFTDAAQGALDRDSWGIGYVTAVNNDDHPMGMVSVIDLDDAADENDELAEWVPDLDPFLERDCYIEWSPSHTEDGASGLHIPVLGTDIPEWWSDSHIDGGHAGADLLANKFCTVTGDMYDGAGAELPTWDDWLVDWLAELYENLTGEQPRPNGNLADTNSATTPSDPDEEWLDEETVEEALEYIDPNCAYSQWRDVGFALGDHFDDHTARHLFDSWSRGSSKYDDDAEKYIEDITSRNGSGVTIGTIVHLAQQGGWEPEPPRSKSRTRTPRELVAEHSDEYDSVEEVPKDLFDDVDTEQESAATDGGATTEESGTESPTDSPSVETTWDDIRRALQAAEDADERAGPRFQAAMKLYKDFEFRTLVENDQLYVYDATTGIYDDDGEAVVRSELTQGLQDQYSAHNMSEAKDHIRGRTMITEDEMGGPEGLIAAANCVIDLNEQTSRDHSPDFHFLSRLGCEFDPDATAPRFKAFLKEVVPSDTEREKLQEYAGYTLMHWGLPYHKALFVVGPTASGKSTFLDTINAMLGEGTVSSLTPQQLTGERFAGAELHGKWANIRNDIPAATVKNTGAFKEIIGGDAIKAERKRKDPFMFEPTAKHLYAANELPATETDDEAFYRRILLVPFPETIPEAERDKHLDDKLQAELPGVLNWAIEGLQRLMHNGGFTGDRSPGRTQDTWQKWSDSVSRFKDAAIEEGGDKEISKAKLYAAYIEYCRQEGIPSDTQHSLTRGLKQEGLADGRSYVDGEQLRVFHNISLTGRGKELLEDAKTDSSDSDDSTASQRRDRGLSDWD